MVQDFVKSIDLGLDPGTQQQLVGDLQIAKHFYDGPYRWKHMERSSVVSTHCMQHALTSTSTVKSAAQHQAHTSQLQCFNCKCDHEHSASYEECNQLHRLHEQLTAHVSHALARGLRGEGTFSLHLTLLAIYASMLTVAESG